MTSTSTEALAADLDARLTTLEEVIVARGLISKVRGAFDELLHPRGRDGRFIEKGGFVVGTFQVANGDSQPVNLEGKNRVKVTGFTKNPNNPDDPYINVVLTNGTPAQGLASQVQSVEGPKAHINPNEQPYEREPARGQRFDMPSEGEAPVAEEPEAEAPFSPDVVEPPSPEELNAPSPEGAPEPETSQVDLFGDDSSFNPPDPNKQSLTPADIAKTQKGPGEPVETDDVEEALELLARGEKVKLLSEDKVTVLLDRMLEVYEDATAKGEEAPIYNLCNVTVEGTNLFCTESKNVNRINMPQFKAIPIPGTPAAQMTPDKRGEVDLTDQFRVHLEEMGVAITDDDMQASHLKATQDELNGSKTAGIGRAIESGTYDEARLFVSRDGYIVDGHHRWSATLGVDLRDGHAGDLYMPVAVIDMDILDILAEANDWTISQGLPQAGLSNNPFGQAAPIAMAEPQSSSETQTALLERTTTP